MPDAGGPASDPVDGRVPAPPAVVHQLFGDRAGLVQRYAALLAGSAVERGLI